IGRKDDRAKELLDELVRSGLVEEIPGASAGGRPPTIYQPVPAFADLIVPPVDPPGPRCGPLGDGLFRQNFSHGMRVGKGRGKSMGGKVLLSRGGPGPPPEGAMNVIPVPTLDQLADDPSRAAVLPPEAVPRLLARCAVIQNALAAHLLECYRHTNAA